MTERRRIAERVVQKYTPKHFFKNIQGDPSASLVSQKLCFFPIRTPNATKQAEQQARCQRGFDLGVGKRIDVCGRGVGQDEGKVRTKHTIHRIHEIQSRTIRASARAKQSDNNRVGYRGFCLAKLPSRHNKTLPPDSYQLA